MLALAASLAVYAVRAATGPLAHVVEHVPDDAFYYLVLARNFARLHQWTSDAGLTVTSGFHALYAWLLAAAYAAFAPGAQEFVRGAVAFGAAATLVALVPAWAHARRFAHGEAAWAAALVASSPNVAANTVAAMEWPLVLLAAGAYAWRLHARPGARGTGAWLFALGALGSLARSDFGLFPACVCAVALLARGADAARLRRAAALGLAGAVCGLGVVLLQDALATGDALQVSARIKYHWGALQPAAVRWDAVWRLLVDLVPGVPASLARGYDAGVHAVAAGLGAVVAWRLLRGRVRATAPGWTLAGGSALAVAGDLALYARNGEVQVWYSANLVVPLACLLTAAFVALGPRARAVAFALVTIVVVRNVATVQARGAHTMPHQRLMLAAGEDVARHRGDRPGRVAAWNAGLIGYVAGGDVVNLDGLVNNDVAPYVLGDSLARYLARRDIRTIVDFESMLEPRYARRGGYADGALERMLRQRAPIATDAHGATIVRWTVDPGAR